MCNNISNFFGRLVGQEINQEEQATPLQLENGETREVNTASEREEAVVAIQQISNAALGEATPSVEAEQTVSQPTDETNLVKEEPEETGTASSSNNTAPADDLCFSHAGQLIMFIDKDSVTEADIPEKKRAYKCLQELEKTPRLQQKICNEMKSTEAFLSINGEFSFKATKHHAIAGTGKAHFTTVVDTETGKRVRLELTPCSLSK